MLGGYQGIAIQLLRCSLFCYVFGKVLLWVAAWGFCKPEVGKTKIKLIIYIKH